MATKKPPSSKGSGKKRKNKGEDLDQVELKNEVLLSMVELDEPIEEVQLTDTSYTSASFESLRPVPSEVSKKKKKGRGLKDQSSKPILTTTSEAAFDSLMSVVEVEQEVDQDVGKKKKGKKRKKEPKEEEVIPDFPKPKGWKTMSRKDRKDWKEQMIIEWRQQQEEEKQAYFAGAKERKERFERERVEQAAMDVEEQEIRDNLLRRTIMLFQEYEKTKADRDAANIEMDKWRQYLKCDGLPDPRIVPQVSTYLQIWRSKANECDINCLIQRSNEVLPMLELLDQLVTYTDQYTSQQLANLNEIRLALQHELGSALDTATYSLLRDLESQLVRVGLQLAVYYRQLRGLHVALWLNVRMPIAKPRANAPLPEPTQLEFPEMRVSVRLPASVPLYCAVVRAARQDYDVLSEHCRTFRLSKPFDDMRLDLYTFTMREHNETERIRLQQDMVRKTFYKHVKERMKELEQIINENKYLKNKNELEELERLTVAEPPPVLSPRDFVAEQRATQQAAYLKSVAYRVRSSELNLRQYRICGGILRLDLLEQPPQPKRMRGELALTVLQSPQGLRWLPFEVSIVVPPPPAPGQTRLPEEIEAEMKLLEAEYEKLALVHIDLPETVLWLEPPVVCHWTEEKCFWTTAHVHDSKYNEDKFTVTFRTGVLWPIGLAVAKYTNLPYQGWELKPYPNGNGVLVTISGVIIVCEFLVVNDHVSLVSLQNGATSALQDIIGKKFALQRLIKIMQDGGCDLFPDFDAHVLIDSSCEKEWPMERHLYHAMAFLSTAYNFQWSRWNATANRRTIIMQIREAVDKKRTATLQLLHVTPLNVNVVKGSEVGSELDLEPVMGMKFYPDLFNLNLAYGSSAARRCAVTMDCILAESVFELLIALKICSFS